MKNYLTYIFLTGLILISITLTGQERSREINQAQNYLSIRPEVYLAVYPESLSKANDISKVISIDRILGDTIFAYANAAQFKKFKELGHDFKVLTPPSLQKIVSTSDDIEKLREWDSYPTYDAYVAMMEQFETDYPQLCRLENIGYSIEGRKILAVKISDKVYLKEAEPEFLYTSSMHGDELTGYILSLRLIDYLLSNYGTNSQVTELVNSLEIYINPLANPDGTYYMGNHTVNGATRGNVNGIDLNRNFPDPEDGLHPDGNPWQQENIEMMNFVFSHNFVLSANFHTGYEVINYPWDTWPELHADDIWYENISRAYADTVHAYSPASLVNYMTAQVNGITNGYQWYTINGSRQDYMNYYLNSREITFELSYDYIPAPSKLPAYWNANHRSLLHYMENCLYGFTEKISEDGNSGMPVIAKVEVIGHDFDNSHIYSHHATGEYYRMLMPGVYNLKFSAPGYKDVVLENLALGPGEQLVYDVEMEINPESIHHPEISKNRIIAYPNPAQDIVSCTFNMPNTGYASFIISDISGKVVQSYWEKFFTKGDQSIEFDLSSFSSGPYFILFVFDNYRKAVKINKD